MTSFADARKALQNGETDCETLVSSFLACIRAQNPLLNAFISVDEEDVLEQARRLDRSPDAAALPLKGMVLGVKDVICMKGRRVTCSSRMLEQFESLYDATAIERLRAAGAIFVGKTNCDEFAMGSSNETSYFGPVRNPANTEYVPGGSSGGSAAAVAAGLCHAALGTDTGGSIRQPAAHCGVAGLKPTYGRVSRSGLVAFASSFDCMGPIGQSAEDCALLLNHMAGRDERDSTSAPAQVPDYAQALTGDVRGLRIGLPKEYFADGLDAGIRSMIEECVRGLEQEGASVREVSLPRTEYGVAAYYILTTAEASSNLARYDGVRYGHRASFDALRATLQREQQALEAVAGADGESPGARLDPESMLRQFYMASRTEGFGDEVKRRIMLGAYVLSSGYYEAYYAKGQQARTLIRNDFEQVFEEVDALVAPVTPAPAFRLGSRVDDPMAMYLSDIYTVPANLAGVPGLSIPLGLHPEAPHLPVGMQILGPHFGEETILRIGRMAERLRDGA